MYTIWFRFYGVHRIDIEGIVEACMAWDALSSQFGMVSARPCNGVGCTHECCVPVEPPVRADDLIVTNPRDGTITIVRDSDDDSSWDYYGCEDDTKRGPGGGPR